MPSDADRAAGNPGVEHNTQAFLEALAKGGGKPIETLAPVDARKVLADAQKGAKLPPADMSEKTITVDGRKTVLNIVGPAGATGVPPAFIVVHGGGWILGDFPTHERFVRDLVVDSGTVGIFVDCTPSPEARYPVAINEICAAIQWMADNGAQVNVDGKRLAIAGNSVDGNMATVVAQMAKVKGSPALRAQVLFWPVTNANFENTSYDEFANGHFLSKDMMKWFWDACTTDARQRRCWRRRNSARACRRHGSGQPRTTYCATKAKPMPAWLDAAVVSVVSTSYNGMIHDFGLLDVLADLPGTRAALHQASQTLKMRLR